MSERIYRPKFYVGEVVPPEFLINRIEELQALKEVLLERRGNVLLVGKRRMGKTSLVHKLMRELEHEKILCVYVDLTIFFGHEVNSFLEEVLLRICYGIGEKIFKKNTSELLSEMGQEPGALKGKYNRFLRIYEIVRAKTISQHRERTTEAGLSTVAQAKLGQVEGTSVMITPLMSFEFIRLVGELRDICRGDKYERIAVFADEANRLADQVSGDILRSYLDVFSSEQVQFLFVADPEVVFQSPHIANIFDRTVTLGPFRGASDIRALLEKYYASIKVPMPFSDEAIAQISRLSRDNPFLVQMLCNGALDVMGTGGRGVVTPDDVLQAWLVELQHQPHLTELWR